VPTHSQVLPGWGDERYHSPMESHQAITNLALFVERHLREVRIAGKPSDPILELPAPQGFAVWIAFRQGLYVATIYRNIGTPTSREAVVGHPGEGVAATWSRARTWLVHDQELQAAWQQQRAAASTRPDRAGRADPPLPRRSRRNVGFPFHHPWISDWVFWWGVVVMLLSAFAYSYDADARSIKTWPGLTIDLVIGLPLNFIFFVIPVAAIRAFFTRRSRSGQSMRYHRELATALATLCPPWDPRVMRFGSELAVVCDTSVFLRDVYVTRDGAWHNLLIFTDAAGDPHQIRPTRRLDASTWDIHGATRIIHDAWTTAYRNAARYVEGEESDPGRDAVLLAARDAAYVCLPYLTAGGR